MGAKHQKFTVLLPSGYTEDERQAIAQDIIDRIVKRTQDENKDKNGKKFPSYSDSYVKSLDFKNAGKSKDDVNLTLSGDTLAAMELLKNNPRKIDIGFEDGSDENAKADGNIRGTYGKKRGDKSKARDFLGISESELSSILARYPLDNDKKRKQAVLESQAAQETAEEAASRIEADNGE